MSDQDQPETTAEVRKSLGSVLRAAREDKKYSIEAVASHLMLEQPVIRGLESGDYQGLPEIAYVRGYLLAYLRLLGQPESLLDEFDQANSNQYPLKLNLSVVSPSCSEDGWVRCISVGLVVLLIAAIGLWLIEQTFQVFESGGLESIGEIVGFTQESPTNETVEAAVYSEDAYPATVNQDIAEITDNRESVGNSHLELPAVEEPSEQLLAEQDESEPSADILIRFSGESWIEINDADGKQLVRGVYKQGQEIILNDDNPPFTVVLGSAGYVYIEYQGQEVGVPRRTGQVARISLGNIQ